LTRKLRIDSVLDLKKNGVLYVDEYIITLVLTQFFCSKERLVNVKRKEKQ